MQAGQSRKFAGIDGTKRAGKISLTEAPKAVGVKGCITLARKAPQKIIPPQASLFDFPGAQGDPHALGRVVGPVKREMTPPSAPVIPKVVVGIFTGGPHREGSSEDGDARATVFFKQVEIGHVMQFLWNSVTAPGLGLTASRGSFPGEVAVRTKGPHIGKSRGLPRQPPRHLGFSKPGCRTRLSPGHS